MECGWAGWGDHVGVCVVMCSVGYGQVRETGCGLGWKPQILEFFNLHLAFHIVKKVCQAKGIKTILFNSF